MNIKNLEKKIKQLMKNEDRQDEEFRLAILNSEIGDLASYITHDQTLNPNARPHGNKEDEVLAYGEALVQLCGLANCRNINLEKAFERGLKNWEDLDWKKSQGTGLTGISASPGIIRSEVYIAITKEDYSKMPEQIILVVPHARPDLALYMSKVLGIITDHGGKTCHAANIAREYNIPCIVGTGKATSILKNGYNVFLDANNKQGKIEINK